MSKLIILAGPSGVGKGTVEKELFKNSELNLVFSISATTRKARNNEIDKEHYFFISKNEFLRKIDNDEFLEWSSHLGNYYGTLKSEIDKNIARNKNVLVEVDTTGAINIINKYKQEKKEDEFISIFILPPSLEELKNRIANRNSETEQSLKIRMEKAKEEIGLTNNFMFCVINDKINKTVKTIEEIIKNK